MVEPLGLLRGLQLEGCYSRVQFLLIVFPKDLEIPSFYSKYILTYAFSRLKFNFAVNHTSQILRIGSQLPRIATVSSLVLARSFQEFSLLLVYLAPSISPVFTWDGMLLFANSSFFISVCSDRLYALKLILSQSFTVLVWVAMLSLVVIVPEGIVWNIDRLMGPFLSKSFTQKGRDMFSISLGLTSPPRKN